MTQDDIALMYQKANGWSPAPYKITMEELERFAQMIAAHEREACAKVCEENWHECGGQCANEIRARGNI